MTISLPWLVGRTFDLYYDQEDRTAGLRKISAGENGQIRLNLEAYGGAVLVSSH